MKYEGGWLWPPRPEKKVPPEMIGYYQRRGYLSQVKKNGTCTVIFSHGSEVIFKTRHNEPHKAWTPMPAHSEFFGGRSERNVYVAELLHSKTPHIRHHIYLFDILVADGEQLVGMTFAERQSLLENRFPRVASSLTSAAVPIGERVSRAVNFTEAAALWHQLDSREDEGLVLKDPSAKLAACVSPISNAGWQIKVRKPTKGYSF